MSLYPKAALYGALSLIALPTGIALAGLVMPAYTVTNKPAQSNSLESLADAAADYQAIPHDIFKALIRQESNWNPDAISSVGAIGLTQVMPATGASHCGFSAEKLKNPDCNLQCGASYLAAQYQRFGDWRLALAAYNSGPNRVISAGGIPAIAETQDYVLAICAASDCGKGAA